MDLSNLKPAAGSIKTRKRIGRGQGSGRGGTSTKGHKGAQSRTGYSRKIGFEGGQMPLQRRVPKFGFKNPNRVTHRPINVSTIAEYIDAGKLETTITIADLVAAGLAHKNEKIKLLGRGDLEQKFEIEVHAASGSAKEKVEKAGGTVTIA